MPDSPNVFFLIVISVITLVRVWLFNHPLKHPFEHTLKTHHYKYGIAILVLGFLMHKIVIYSIGFGLIASAIPTLLVANKELRGEYELNKSFTALLVVIILIFVLRDSLTPLF